MPEISTS